MASIGRAFVFSSPSGGGKTTVIRELMDRNPAFRRSVSATTRTPRADEIDGMDYRFLSEAAFERLIGKGELLEWAEVHGHYYGTPREPVESCIREGGTVLLALDVQGAMALQKHIRGAVLVFLLPPSIDLLRRRLLERGTEGFDAVAERIRNAEAELRCADRYPYQVINDRLLDTVTELEYLIHYHQQQRAA